jgi:ribonuclease VapC
MQVIGANLSCGKMDELLESARIAQVPFDQEQAQGARTAWLRYGKGNHPAGLNFGDCFSYALAKVTGEPLLFKGSDFSKTDVRRA